MYLKRTQPIFRAFQFPFQEEELLDLGWTIGAIEVVQDSEGQYMQIRLIHQEEGIELISEENDWLVLDESEGASLYSDYMFERLFKTMASDVFLTGLL